jgi:anti-sigma B factor antagonist
MEISTRPAADATIVDVFGDITLENSVRVRKVLMDSLKARGTRRVLVNMLGVEHIDSAGVASLVEGLKLSRDLKTSFALFGLGRLARGVLELTRLINLFEVYATEEEALKGDTRASAP